MTKKLIKKPSPNNMIELQKILDVTSLLIANRGINKLMKNL